MRFSCHATVRPVHALPASYGQHTYGQCAKEGGQLFLPPFDNKWHMRSMRAALHMAETGCMKSSLRHRALSTLPIVAVRPSNGRVRHLQVAMCAEASLNALHTRVF